MRTVRRQAHQKHSAFKSSQKHGKGNRGQPEGNRKATKGISSTIHVSHHDRLRSLGASCRNVQSMGRNSRLEVREVCDETAHLCYHEWKAAIVNINISILGVYRLIWSCIPSKLRTTVEDRAHIASQTLRSCLPIAHAGTSPIGAQGRQSRTCRLQNLTRFCAVGLLCDEVFAARHDVDGLVRDTVTGDLQLLRTMSLIIQCLIPMPLTLTGRTFWNQTMTPVTPFIVTEGIGHIHSETILPSQLNHVKTAPIFRSTATAGDAREEQKAALEHGG